jgi:hypothetical protein
MSTSDNSDISPDVIDDEGFDCDAISNFSGEELTDDDDPRKIANTALSMMSPGIESSVSLSSIQVVTREAKGRLIKSRSGKDGDKKEIDEKLTNAFFDKLSSDAHNVLMRFRKFNEKKEQDLADMVMRNAVKKYSLTKRVVLAVFRVGYSRYKRVVKEKRLIMKKEDLKFKNAYTISDADLQAFKDFIISLPKSPCTLYKYILRYDTNKLVC